MAVTSRDGRRKEGDGVEELSTRNNYGGWIVAVVAAAIVARSQWQEEENESEGGLRVVQHRKREKE